MDIRKEKVECEPRSPIRKITIAVTVLILTALIATPIWMFGCRDRDASPEIAKDTSPNVPEEETCPIDLRELKVLLGVMAPADDAGHIDGPSRDDVDAWTINDVKTIRNNIGDVAN